MVSVVYKDGKVRCFDKEGFIVDIDVGEDISKDEFDEIADLCVELLKSMKGTLSKQTYDEVMDERGREASFCEDLCGDDRNCFAECIENYRRVVDV